MAKPKATAKAARSGPTPASVVALAKAKGAQFVDLEEVVEGRLGIRGCFQVT